MVTALRGCQALPLPRPSGNLRGMPPPVVFLGLGSNVGDREGHLAAAEGALARRGFRLEVRSSTYLTEPKAAPGQGWFLNEVWSGSTALPPEVLMAACLDAERELGRVRGPQPRAPRTIDVDLLLYGQEVRAEPPLILPHPRLHERRFVLVPLAEIAPQVVHPLLGLSAGELLRRCPDPSRVTLHRQRGTGAA
jgi:2-amino-4-hydroxy-6-hydroxymethyldihydropteridine diphosphokinase